jgi:DNA invertase Pin-like site-specific DNA recombinase
MTKSQHHRAALYLRVSTRGVKNGREQSPENQRKQLRAFAEAMEWSIVAEYEDRESGAKGAKERPGFNALMEAASRREFDTLLVWSLDRFSREGIGKTFNHLKRLDSYGVKFRSYSESFLDTTAEFGELVAAIFAFVASFERKRIAERIAAGLARARVEGTTLGRPRVPVNRMRVWKLHDQGKSIRGISKALELSHGTVQRALAARAGRIGSGKDSGAAPCLPAR